MRCKIADLLVEVPTEGGLASLCQEYHCEDDRSVDIYINPNEYRRELYSGDNQFLVSYMESGIQFYTKLVDYQGLMLHASAVEMNGKAYLFSGDCGIGKSTHTRQWKNLFGEVAQIFNDDKPALRYLDGTWYAYGTPWSGKDGININMKVPLAGICFLKKGHENRIRRLLAREAILQIVKQTRRKLGNPQRSLLLLGHVDHLVKNIPCFELENRPELEAARLSYETMRRAAEEAGP